MGYSMRTIDFRYIAWLNWDQHKMTPLWDDVLFEEELYDHRKDNLTNRYYHEMVNHANDSSFTDALISLRHTLLNYLFQNVTYNMKSETEVVEASQKMKFAINMNKPVTRFNLVSYGGARYRGVPSALGSSRTISF